ncbi:MAG: type II secretion system protein GspG [Planctomycetaceae bacterium]|nr:type II secretion system protein GspG [Planctomycetaceae bacterium]
MKKYLVCSLGVLIAVTITFCFLLRGDTATDSKPFVPPPGTELLRISPETTFLAEPLLPDGKTIDFSTVIEEYFSAGAASEENGFRDIVRLLGRKIVGDISDEKWNTLCQKLNLDPNAPPEIAYTPLVVFLTKEKSSDETSPKTKAYQIIFSLATPGKIPPEHLEIFERWFHDMEPAFSAMSEALKKPVFLVPTSGWIADPITGRISDWPDPTTGLLAQREFIEIFSNRCNFWIAKRDAERGLEDLPSIFRIVRNFERQPSFDSSQIGNRFERTALLLTRNLLNNLCTTTPEKLRKLLDVLESLPPRRTFEDQLEIQRIGWLKNISDFPKKGPEVFGHRILEVSNLPFVKTDDQEAIRKLNEGTEKTIRIYREVPFDWNIVAEILNAGFDDREGKSTKQALFHSKPELRKIYDETKIPELSSEELLKLVEKPVKDAMDELKRIPDNAWNLKKLKAMSLEERSIFLGKALSASRVARPEVYDWEVREGITAFELAKTAIALKLYKMENGSYPDSLDRLVEKGYLAKVPNDPYSPGKASPFLYQNEPSGGCSLSSVAPKGKNDTDEDCLKVVLLPQNEE